MKLTKEGKATGLMFLASFLWGSSFVGSKICLNAGMLQFETVFYRMVIAVIGIGIVFHKQLRPFSRAAIKTGLAVGAITSAIYTAEMYGISLIETTKASFLTSTNIVMMPFLCAVFFRERVQLRSFLAAAVTITGVAVLSLAGGERLTIEPGDALLLLAALGYAMSSITVAKLGSGASSIQITFVQLFVTMVYTGIMTLFQGRGGHYPPQAVGALLYLAIGPTLVCFLIKNYALQHLSPMKCTLILTTEGVFCALLSVLILHDRVTARMLLGIALIFLGILTENFGEQIAGKIRRRVNTGA